MLKYVYVHPKVEKDIARMITLDNAPCIAAGRAQAIIEDLIKGGRISQTGRLSGSKDARIKNLIKFNLGKGYRLVTIKEKDDLFVMFIGDHDQCDRWLYSYSRKNPHRTSVGMNIHRTKDSSDGSSLNSAYWNEAADDMFEDLNDISQKALRKVFCGLISSV